jgi:hypothetical protein
MMEPLGEPWEEELTDLRFVEEEGAKLGLHLNHGELDLICDEISTRAKMLFQAPGLQTVNCSQATLLGTPIGGMY